MKTRRGFIGAAVSAMAGMLGIHKARALPADRKYCRIVPGFWGGFDKGAPKGDGFSIRHVWFLQRDNPTDPICIADVGENVNALLAKVAQQIQAKVGELIDDGATKVAVHWCNIPDSEFNPDGHTGRFLVRGYKISDGSHLPEPKFTPPLALGSVEGMNLS
jgi:hypothetical protein